MCIRIYSSFTVINVTENFGEIFLKGTNTTIAEDRWHARIRNRTVDRCRGLTLSLRIVWWPMIGLQQQTAWFMIRVKSTLLMLTTHLTCVTITTMMYFVTVVTNPSFLPRRQMLRNTWWLKVSWKCQSYYRTISHCKHMKSLSFVRHAITSGESCQWYIINEISNHASNKR